MPVKIPEWATVVNLLHILQSVHKTGKAQAGLSCNVIYTALRQVRIRARVFVNGEQLYSKIPVIYNSRHISGVILVSISSHDVENFY